MNRVATLTAVLMDSQQTCRMLQRRVALIHSTTILDSRRKGGNRNYRSKYSKSTKKQYKSAQFWSNEPNTRWPGNKGPKNKGKRGFQFTDDDVEIIFRSKFGVENGCSFWSFVNEEKTERGSFYKYTNFWDSQNWRDQFEDKYDSYTEPDYSSKSDLTSDRKALGLTLSGPLKLEEIKKAYRACALKWHPDHHQGSSKVAAEEKFKVCSAAYNALCDNLALK